MLFSPKEFNIRYQASFLSKDDKNTVKIWLAKPGNSSTQTIKSFSINHKPKSVYRDNHGNEILYFELEHYKKINLQFDITAVLLKSKNNLNQDNISLPKPSTKITKAYTKSEKFLKQIPSIKKITNNINNDTSDVIKKVKFIFNFIISNFKYCYPVKNRGVKYLNLNNLKGDCGEYSSLFVVMSRLLNIPAINKTGFVIFPKEKNINEHGWASLYLRPFGWINFDPQYASLDKRKSKYFGQTPDYRLVFTNGFNIPLKPSIPKNFSFTDCQNLGLPMTNNSAQTLQPLAFASKYKVIFRDKISLL